ncbi:hypothetical protein HK104_003472 [Borealophlyctis nickersoniae]|nr:hypothetical protein HK104_003472 [Borealophlyctis nickersoniae]
MTPRTALTLLLLSTFSLLTTAVPVLHRRQDAVDPAITAADTDVILFKMSIEDFLSARAFHSDIFDWSSDGCSKSPDQPGLGDYNFLPSCERHDFGYRNYKKQGRFNEDTRGKIDDNLKKDLYNECKKQPNILGVECRRTADVYWAFVRNLGDGKIKLP